MELDRNQIQQIIQLTRAYYDYLAQELAIVNPAADIEAYKKQIINAILAYARGRVIPTIRAPTVSTVRGTLPTVPPLKSYRRVTNIKRPEPRRWDMNSVVTNQIRRNLADILNAVEPDWRVKNAVVSTSGSPDDLFLLIEQQIKKIKMLPTTTPLTTPRTIAAAATVMPTTVRTLPVGAQAPAALPTIPRLSTPVRQTSPRVSSPLAASALRGSAENEDFTKLTASSFSGPSSDVEVNVLLEKIQDLAPAMRNKAQEIARVLGIDEEDVIGALELFVQQ